MVVIPGTVRSSLATDLDALTRPVWIRRDRRPVQPEQARSVWSGQIDAEHQAADLAVGGSDRSRDRLQLHRVGQRLQLRASQRPLGQPERSQSEQTPLGYRATR
jgi:hypothetical protein